MRIRKTYLYIMYYAYYQLYIKITLKLNHNYFDVFSNVSFFYIYMFIHKKKKLLISIGKLRKKFKNVFNI